MVPRSFSNRGDSFVFVLKSREAANVDDFETVKDDRMAAILSRKESSAVEAFVRELKEKAEVRYNNELIDAYLGRR